MVASVEAGPQGVAGGDVQPAIEARDLGIRFARGRKRRLSIRELFIHGLKQEKRGSFYAVRNASFTIAPGERVGIIGGNGAGKSTLLKMVAGALVPDEGTVAVNGKVAPLLELKAGFAPDLTGRENVRLVGALYGLTRQQIDDQMDSIIAFAELEDFADSPVKHYSTGMRVRLGFSLVATLPHPILLMDEVFAVGDKAFRRKCYQRLEKILAEGRTLLLVSHNERDLKRFCGRAIYLQHGEVVSDGPLADVLEDYRRDAGDDD